MNWLGWIAIIMFSIIAAIAMVGVLNIAERWLENRRRGKTRKN